MGASTRVVVKWWGEGEEKKVAGRRFGAVSRCCAERREEADAEDLGPTRDKTKSDTFISFRPNVTGFCPVLKNGISIGWDRWLDGISGCQGSKEKNGNS
jgi:hypothetical protein